MKAASKAALLVGSFSLVSAAALGIGNSQASSAGIPTISARPTYFGAPIRFEGNVMSYEATWEGKKELFERIVKDLDADQDEIKHMRRNRPF